MTRARPASYGLGNPPPLDRWIDAVLMLFAILVQGVAATFGMSRSRKPRDWHTQHSSSALPQTKPDIHIKDPTTPTDLKIRVPRAGGDPVSAHSALPTRTTPTPVIPAEARQRAELEPSSHARRRLHAPPLASGSHSRASGMTRIVRVKSS